MMIAEKLLACAKPAPIDPKNTLFLANWTTIGAPVAQVGTLGYFGAEILTPYSCRLYGAGGYVTAEFLIPSGDWVFELFFDGGTVPSMSSSPSYFAGTLGGVLYLSDNGGNWSHIGTIPPRVAGMNHMAFGMQAGVMQAWLNGSRFISGPASPYPYPGPGSITMAGSGINIGPVRAVGADVYGDNAIITVPTLPLGIV